MKDLKALFKQFFPYFKDYKFEFFIAIVGMILSSVGTAVSAYLVKPILDEIFINKDKELLYLLPYAIILVYALKEAGRYAQAYYTSYIGQDIIRRFRDRVLENLLTLDMDFFHKYRSGELISRIINDIERIRQVVSSMIPEFFMQIITILGLLSVVLYQSFYLSIFALIIMPLAIYPLSKLAKRMKKISLGSQEKVSDLTAKLNQIFSNIEAVQANNAQNYELSNFKDENQKYFKLNMKSVKVNELTSPLMETLGSIGVAVVVIIGGSEVIDGKMSVGSFFSFLTALFMLYTPIKKISNTYNKMQDAIVATKRTFFLIDLQPTIISGSKSLPEDIKSINFSDVSLNYGEKNILKNINLQTKKGELTALVGDSGGGKSSLMNLLMRFYDKNQGQILINNADIEEFDIKNLRQNIAIVTQRVYIFNDTIAKNVAYGKEVDEKKVINALKLANIYDFVESLDDGIDSILDEFGAKLSGGQRQRIAIARAIYTDPKILIFDEATSALDNTSEQKIIHSLENLRENRIVFIIAHRLSTIKKATQIALLKNGSIVALGNDAHLSENSTEYQKLKGIFKD